MGTPPHQPSLTSDQSCNFFVWPVNFTNAATVHSLHCMMVTVFRDRLTAMTLPPVSVSIRGICKILGHRFQHSTPTRQALLQPASCRNRDLWMMQTNTEGDMCGVHQREMPMNRLSDSHVAEHKDKDTCHLLLSWACRWAHGQPPSLSLNASQVPMKEKSAECNER